MRIPGVPNKAWTEAEIITLTELWKDGWSGAHIGKHLDRSRNSVMSKLFTQKLLGNRTAAAKKAAGRPKGKRKQRAKFSRFTGQMLPSAAAPDDRPLRGTAWIALPGTKPVSLIELEAGMCRWPIGEKPMLFCGCAQKDGSSYCAEHARLAAGRGTGFERDAVKQAVIANKAEWAAGRRARVAA